MHVYGYENKLNGKWYVGKSETEDVNKRQIAHRGHVRNGSKSQFYDAVRKYGWQSFEFHIIAQAADRSELAELESRIISEKNSYKRGYNATMGGDGGDTFKGLSEERKERRRRQVSEDRKEFWENNRERMMQSQHKRDFSYRQDPAYRLHQSNAKKRKYVVQDPDGELYEFKGKEMMKEFFAEMNSRLGHHGSSWRRISPNNLIAQGKSKGWTLVSGHTPRKKKPE